MIYFYPAELLLTTAHIKLQITGSSLKETANTKEVHIQKYILFLQDMNRLTSRV